MSSSRIVCTFVALLALPDWSVSAAELDASQVERHFDRFWQAVLEEGDIPGGIVAVTDADNVLLLKGYGTRDVETGAPADSRRTLLKIGSVSKLFTSLAVLSLVEEGRLALDTDVNRYLEDLRVPDNFSTPVTLENLLTHRGGFDSNLTGYMAYSNEHKAVSPAEFERHLVRLREPNRVLAYDNTGVSLLGYLAGKAHGGTYAQAIQARILGPLGMTSSQVGVTDDARSDVAACHRVETTGELVRCRNTVMRDAYQGAGALTVTAADMTRFMRALLNEGSFAGGTIVSAETFAEFADTDHRRLHPAMPGLGYIVREYGFRGRRALGHRGGFDGFSTQLVFFPQDEVAVFICLFNYPGLPNPVQNLAYVLESVERSELAPNTYGLMRNGVDGFAAAFLPPTPSAQRPAVPARSTPLSVLEGRYRSARLNGYPLLDRMLARLQPVIEVQVAGDAALTVDGDGPYVETEPWYFRAADSDSAFGFRVTDSEVILQPAGSGTEYLRVPFIDRASLVLYPIPLALIVLLTGAFLAPGTALPARARKRVRILAPASALLVSAGLLLDFQFFPGAYYLRGDEVSILLWRGLIVLGAVGMIATVANLAALRSVRSGTASSPAAVVHGATLALAVLVVLALLGYWWSPAGF